MPLGHVAAPVQPVVAPLDKGSIPLEAPEAFLSPGALPFLLAALPRYHTLIMPARRHDPTLLNHRGIQLISKTSWTLKKWIKVGRWFEFL